MTTTLFGFPLDHARARMGSLAQCARIDKLTYDDGPKRGSRLLRVVTGGGLSFEVHPDRALDIGALEIGGKNCSWLSPTGITHPAFHEGMAPNFLRTFGGGFLLTCGLDHIGVRAEQDGQVWPQHGRIGATPAELTHAGIDSGVLRVSGTVRQVAAMQEHLELVRTIEAPLGGTELTVTDVVTNRAQSPQPHQVLYHCNFGWPLLSEAATVRVQSTEVAPTTEVAAGCPWTKLVAPEVGYKERVYLHTMKAGRVQAQIDNPETKLRMTMDFDSAALPGLVQWKMLAKEVYALGVEPTNVLALGSQAQLRAKKMLPTLEPGEAKTYSLHFVLAQL